MSNFFENRIEIIPGLGPQKAALLQTELSVFTLADLIQYYPFRYEDRNTLYPISALTEEMPGALVHGRIENIADLGEGKSKRLVATFFDGEQVMDLVWFRGIEWARKQIRKGVYYLAYGKPTIFQGKASFMHPDLEVATLDRLKANYLTPVYNTSEKMKKRFLDSKGLVKIMQALLRLCHDHFNETLPEYIIDQFGFLTKRQAIISIHFPTGLDRLEKARARLKFEELFYIQLRMLRLKTENHESSEGFKFKKKEMVSAFYSEHLPFKLTQAQRRVLKEIHTDCNSGKQMNRLLQGDVGSGKTIVAFIAMLMALDNDLQACLMAPTEILTEQHFVGLGELAQKIPVSIAKLTGSTKKKDREKILANLSSGELKIIIGTHSLLEDSVVFKQLGICVIDEQHRFGVAQRARMWHKNQGTPPHLLVMTATPIPRTLAMTVYGDLDVSIIDQLPPGRKPIKTIHRYDSQRLNVFGFMREEIAKGRQIYIVYPLIEESESMSYKDLMDGYESITRSFPPPEYQVSIVHGKMKNPDRDYEMQRFIKGETQIMVATTVIEVGVNVPNASVMVIESAEKFGLSQLHQLRGRVGRGAEQSYCILMTDVKLSAESRVRIKTMCETNNGFEIADVDLKLRGPGDLSGTKQSGINNLLIADLAKDGEIVRQSHQFAEQIATEDPFFLLPAHAPIKAHIDSLKTNSVNWSRIS